MELTALTNDELILLRQEILTEQGRRSNLLAIPSQIAALAHTYTAAGGDRADLTAALGD